MKVVTVVPAEKRKPDGPHSVMGTKVVLEDGSHLEQVQKLELIADPGRGVWIARIEVMLQTAPEVCALIEADAASVTNTL